MRLEFAQDRVRVFDTVDGLLQEIFIAMQMPTRGLGQVRELGQNHHTACALIRNDAVTLQRLHVHSEVFHRQSLRVGGLGRPEKAVPKRPIACPDPAELDADHSPAVQRQQPPDRAREPHAGFVPAHRFGKRQSADQVRQDFAQDCDGRAARLPPHREHVLSFGSPPNFQAADRDALRPRKADRRSRRLPGCVVGRGLGGPHHLLDGRGLPA